MVETAEMILGRPSGLAPFNFPPDEAPNLSARRLKTLIKKKDRGRGVIILSDLFGGTPGSLALSMLEAESVEVITGVNLPMAIAASTLKPDLDLSQAADTLMRSGRESIKGGGIMLKENLAQA